MNDILKAHLLNKCIIIFKPLKAAVNEGFVMPAEVTTVVRYNNPELVLSRNVRVLQTTREGYYSVIPCVIVRETRKLHE